MRRSTLAIAVWAVATLAGSLVAAPAQAQTWTITTIDNVGDVGRYTDLQIDSAGDLHVLYYRNDDQTLKLISKTSGAWGTATVIDNSGSASRGTVGIGPANVRKIAYRRTDTGAQWYAGPELPRTWAAQAVVQDEDVGRYLQITMLSSGEIGVAYRNETRGALHHVRRQAAGSWTTPVVVDPGPSRGRYFDLVYRSGDGYVFSEYGLEAGMVLLADPSLHGRSWSIEQATAQADNVGHNLTLLKEADGSLLAAFRNETRGSLQYVRRSGGSWTLPITVDPGPNRGQYIDVALRQGVGYAFSEYDAAEGALLLADPAVHARAWAFEAVTSEADANVGRGLSLIVPAGNTLAAAYRNDTDGSLQYVRRETGGWTSPVTVDPGPQRGGYCDIAYRPAVGYCFSERDGGQGAVMMAHPSIRPRLWNRYCVDPRLDAGLQASTFVGPLGRLACAYLGKDASGKLDLRAVEIIPDSVFTVRFVADSVSMSPNGHVRPDVFVTPGEDWYISYRKAGPQDLYMASTDDWQLMPSDVPDTENMGLPGRNPDTFLGGAYPNPSPSSVRIHFSSARETEGVLELYGPDGRVVREVPLHCRKGANTFAFDGRTTPGSSLASGVYFVRLRIGGQVLGPRKIVVIGREGTSR